MMRLIQDASEEKLRGGFYTPIPIVDCILKWAINGQNNYKILEPSCGEGIFLKRIMESKFEYSSIKAIEIIPGEAAKTKMVNLNNCEVLNQDFFQYCNDTKINLI